MFNIKKKKLIKITKGVGSGSTQLAAFDAALRDAGIANFNLIKLSSIIPQNSLLEKGIPVFSKDDFGKKLYIVISEKRESEKGREAWAGIGWVQAEDGRGLFVEQHGAQESEVSRLITETLKDMMAGRDDNFGDIQSEIIGIACDKLPVCALVVAVYTVEDW